MDGPGRQARQPVSARSALLEANGGQRYKGYGEIFRRYLLRPEELPTYSFLAATAEASVGAG